jgi:hypothetical protein
MNNKEPVMKTARLTLLVLVAIAAASATTWASATPIVENTDMETRAVSGSLEKTFNSIVDHADDAVWIGYSVPMVAGTDMCCGDSRRRHCLCRLERENNTYHNVSDRDEKEMRVNRDMFVLYRVEDRRVERLRAYSENCELDAGGVPMIWLTDVSPVESIELLKSFALSRKGTRKVRERVNDNAVSTIAMHEDPTVMDVLEEFVEPGQRDELREKAVFWIGAQGGSRAIKILTRLLHDDPDSEVREQAIFALTLPDDPEAIETIIRVARNDRDPDVRSNALFWLANEAGERATETIQNAIENDPDTDVKEQAVFALSQLPRDEGVPLLIRVARTNRNSEVREQAIFWLGQSDDERALDFFEEILSR